MAQRVIEYADVVSAAAELFVETATIDMQELADAAAVSRATLYRVAPGRDRVLGDVLWHFGGQHHAAARAAAPGRGPQRVVRVLRHFCDTVHAQRSFLGFLAEEPDTAMRVLLTPSGGVHERFNLANAELLTESLDDPSTLPFDVDTTAYVLSRVYESMLYADLISGREPTLDVADRTALAVLTST